MRLMLAFCFCFFAGSIFAQHYFLFIGTYTSGKSKGIYVYDFNSQNGETKWISNTDSASNPSFLTIAPDGKHIYAVNEISRAQAGLIAAYNFNPADGKLSLINRVSSGTENPCHVSITKNGKWLTAANYSGGSLAVFPVNTDGSVAPFVQHLIHTGKGYNPQRQEKPHVHSSFFTPDEKYLFSPDLGLDKVFIYPFNTKATTQPLTENNPSFITTQPGAGPRHLDFSPDGKYIYLIEEMGGEVDAYTYSNGKARQFQRIPAHPSDFKGQPGSADIHVSPDGKFVYASNRGSENNIAIYTVDPGNGSLKMNGYQSTMGEGPRNFMIDPTGKFLLVANQKTDNIILFKREMKTGLLTKVSELSIPNPVCLKMLDRGLQ